MFLASWASFACHPHAHARRAGLERSAKRGGPAAGAAGGPPRLYLAAMAGDLAAVRRLLIAGAAIDDTNGKGSTALHLALQQRHQTVAEFLLAHGADVNATSKKLVTPLHVAAACCTALIPQLIAKGANPTIRTQRRQTAADIAKSLGHTAAAAALVAAETEWVDSAEIVTLESSNHRSSKASGSKARPTDRCPLCREAVNLGKLRRIRDGVLSGAETNPYVLDFASRHEGRILTTLLSDTTFHRALNNKQLRKELSETWALVKAIEKMLVDAGVMDPASVQFVDLCSGKSLTATLLTLLYPTSPVLAVDRVHPATAPHFVAPAQFLQADIHHPSFPAMLRDALDSDRQTIVCGMHLCGALSPSAVELFAELPSCIGMVLSPCCLPSNHLYNNAQMSGSKDPRTQYEHWCTSLGDFMKPHVQHDSDGLVTVKIDPHILSTKNMIICGVRHTSCEASKHAGPASRTGIPLQQLCSQARKFASRAHSARAAMLERKKSNAEKREAWDREHQTARYASARHGRNPEARLVRAWSHQLLSANPETIQ